MIHQTELRRCTMMHLPLQPEPRVCSHIKGLISICIHVKQHLDNLSMPILQDTSQISGD